MYNYDEETKYDSNEVFDSIAKTIQHVVKDWNDNNKIYRSITVLVITYPTGIRELVIADSVYNEIIVTSIISESINRYTNEPHIPLVDSIVSKDFIIAKIEKGITDTLYLAALKEKGISTW